MRDRVTHHWITHFLAIATVSLISLFVSAAPAHAANCSVPNQISNGQTADAAPVMNNFNALKDCINGSAALVGTPTPGSLPVFVSSTTVGSGNLSGDCTTAGTVAVTCTKTNGTSFGPLATSSDAGQLTGQVSVSRFDNGTNADSSHFLRGDGVWAVPPTGGDGGSTNGTPSIRATSIASFNASSVTIPWPTGTVAGDVVLIFVSDGYAVNSPAGWVIFNNTGSNDWANGLTAAKTMTSADITAGGTTVTLIGAYNGVAAAVTINGTSLNGVRQISAARSSGSTSYSSAQVVGLYDAKSTDLIVGFTYIRGAMNPTISNFTQLQLVNSANASAYLAQFGSTLGKLGVGEVATYPAANNGYYWSMVALH